MPYRVNIIDLVLFGIPLAIGSAAVLPFVIYGAVRSELEWRRLEK